MYKLHERKIENILKKLGLNKSEILVFIIGLRSGPSTIIQLAKASETKRITTHAIVERLINKGLFLETASKKKRLVYPNTLDSLKRLLDKKRFELHELEDEVKSAEAILKSIQTQSERFPKIRFYKGKEGVSIMVDEIISDKAEVHMMSDAQHFYDLIDNDFLEKSLVIRNKHNIKVQMIFPVGFEHFCYTQGTYEQKLDIKALPDNFPIKGGVTVWGEKVAFHSYADGFVTTTIVENLEIASIMLFMFQNVWLNAKEY